MTHSTDRSRRGSIYVVVLVTIASVSMMVLAGVALRRGNLDASYLHAQAIHAQRGAESGIAMMNQRILDHDAFIKEAADGVLLSNAKIGDTRVDVAVSDEDTGAAIRPSTDLVLAVSDASMGDARSVMARSYEYTSEYHRLAVEYGAVAYWALDEATGETHADESIQRLEAPYPDPDNAGTVVHEHDNHAPRFPTESDILESPHAQAYEVESLSIALWVRFANGSVVQGVFAKESASFGLEPHHAMYFYNGDLVHQITLYSKFSFVAVAADKSHFDDNDWHFVVVSSGKDKRLRLFVDGDLVDRSTSGWLGLTNGGAANTHPWTIGGRRDDAGKPGYLDDNLDGSVARIAVFDTELTEDQIEELESASSERDRFSPLPGSWTRGP